MPRKCCVPLCKSNYDSTNEYVTVFTFPSDSDMREKWKKCIQRKEWSPTKYSVVCRHHFLPCDIILSDKFIDESGVEYELPRKYPILKSNAYPSVFPELPADFEPPQTRKVPEKRASEIVSRYKNKTSEWLSLDYIQDFQTLRCQITTKLKDLLDKNWKMYTVTEGTSCLVLYTISVKADIAPSVAVSVKVLPDMYVEVYLENKRVACTDLDCILTKSKLERWSQLENLLIYYMETDPATSLKSVSDLLEDACSNLDIARELLLSSEDTNVQTTEKQLLFITEQLQLISKSKYGNMVSQSMSSSNNIKLEPVSETDGVDSSDKEILTEIQACDEMENEMPASVKIEQPEVYIDYPDQEMHPSFESYPSISTQEHSQLEMFGGIDNVRQELSDCLYEDTTHNFGKIIGLTGVIIQEKTKHTSTERRSAVNDYRVSLKDENCQVSDSGLSVSQINDEQLLMNENCQLQDVDTVLNHTQTSVKDLHNAVGHDRSSSQRMQDGADVCDSVSVNRQNRTYTGENICKCDECSASFTTVAGLKYHKKTHTGEKPCKCDVYGASFITNQQLDNHKRTHTGQKPYKCDVCSAYFNTIHQMKNHKRTHTGEKPYKCDVCSTSYTTNQQLKHHRRKHTGEKPYKCYVCGLSYATYKQLKCHKITHTGDKPYKCDECHATFTSKHQLNYHKRKHAGEKPYSCDECGASFTGAAGLKYHERTHTGEKPYKCDVCSASFSINQHLKYHKRTHTGEKPYKCDVCGASFTTNQQMNGHKKTHTGDKPYKCNVCDASYTTNQHLKYHNRKHTGEKPYKCDACDSSYATNKQLKYHKITHTGVKPYKCGECCASFTDAAGLKYHKRTHTGERPYICDLCGASYIANQQLMHHKMKHTGEKPYRCDLCGASYALKKHLTCHKRTHTGEKPYKCDECGVSFTGAAGLVYHKRSHTGEKPYKCDECGASYFANQQLVCHKRTHTGEKPYKCDECSTSYTSSKQLKYHKRTHTGEKPYKCDLCEASFTGATSLKRHKRTHTGEKPYKCDDCSASFTKNTSLNNHRRRHQE